MRRTDTRKKRETGNRQRRRGPTPKLHAVPLDTPVVIPTTGIRLNKYISQSGLCARRKADALISEGRVAVNQKTVTQLGTRVYAGDDVVVDGRSISPQQHAYILANKPSDAITTRSDERNRRTVMDALRLPPDLAESLNPVGRLDRRTTGVLLLTNDGELAHRLAHPRYGIKKIYRVTTKEPVTPDQLEALRDGVQLDDGFAQADRVEYAQDSNPTVIAVSMHSGRNRIVRRMFEKVGHHDVRLERIAFAGLSVRGVRSGRWRRLSRKEISRLYRLVGLRERNRNSRRTE